MDTVQNGNFLKTKMGKNGCVGVYKGCMLSGRRR